jgi:Flp pilus assembly pilin Flp
MGLLGRVTALLRHDDGAQMVEYAFLLLGVALVVFIAAEVFGLSIRDALLLPMAWL